MPVPSTSSATCGRWRSPAWRRWWPGSSPASFPALQAGRASLAPTLKSGAREGTYQRSRTRTILLVLQGALSVLLLVGAGLFVRSLHNVRAMRLGYDVDPVMLVYPEPSRASVCRQLERAELARRLVEAARAMPEVESAARGISVPF